MESANGQSTGLGGVGWGADALSEAPGHLAKPTSPFLCRSLLSSTLAPGTRPPSPPSDSHPPGGCQLTPLLSDWGAFKAQLDPAIPPHTHMHTLRSPSPFQIQGTQHTELVHSGAQTFPRTGTRGFALRSSRFLGGQRTIPLPCTGTCDRSRRCKTSAPSPRTPFQRGRPQRLLPRGLLFVLRGMGPSCLWFWGTRSPCLGPCRLDGTSIRKRGCPWARGPTPPLSVGSGEWGGQFSNTPPGRLEDPGQENEVG